MDELANEFLRHVRPLGGRLHAVANNGVADSIDITVGTSQDCEPNGVPDECEMDCNNNGIGDLCDITSNFSQDCNVNDVPDECEFVDCNANGALDSCDVLGGQSQDCDGNGRPDECDVCTIAIDPGPVFLSGDDADDSGHCGGASCGRLYPSILSYAVEHSNSPGVGILAVGVNGGAANSSLMGWNSPVNGGPGAAVTVVNDPVAITSVNLRDYDVLYLPSSSIHTGGGFTSAQLAALNSRQAAIADFVNVHGGSVVALTQAGEPEAYGWLPIPILTEDRTHVSVCPTPGLATLAPDATCQNLSHCCYHTVFTGPPGFLGLDALAMSTDAPVGEVLLLGGTTQGLCAPDCNANSVPDECELASGDCNENDFLDECETNEDCNGNSVPDLCDIGGGTSMDCDGNSIPDECEPDCNQNGLYDVCELLPQETDACESAALICPGGHVHDSTGEATNDGSASCGDSSASADAWYKYIPRTSGNLNVSTCGSSFDTVVSVHTGCPLGGTEVACNDDSCGTQASLDISVTAGTEYLIRVSGKGGSSGAFELELTGPPCELRPASDCNGNASLDECDISNKGSLDLNGNGIPDECEPPLNIPAASAWSLAVMALAMSCVASILMRNRRFAR